MNMPHKNERLPLADRFARYRELVCGRWLTLDEVRALEDMPPIAEVSRP